MGLEVAGCRAGRACGCCGWCSSRSSFPAVHGPPVYEPLDPEETPKGVALAALKEIEFDRETGKLSDEDYAFLKGKYTGRGARGAAGRIGGGSRGGSREPGEAGAQKAGVGPQRQDGDGDVEAMIAARVRALRSAATSAPPGAPVCSTCGPRPEPDAVFCSTCGHRLRRAAPAQAAAPSWGRAADSASSAAPGGGLGNTACDGLRATERRRSTIDSVVPRSPPAATAPAARAQDRDRPR